MDTINVHKSSHRHYHHHSSSSPLSRVIERSNRNLESKRRTKGDPSPYGDVVRDLYLCSPYLLLRDGTRLGEERRDNRRERFSGRWSLRALPSSDFQVTGSPFNRLPTLKELIGYRTNEYTSDPVFLSLLPQVPRERDTNFLLNEDGGSSSNEPESHEGAWTLRKIDGKEGESLMENGTKYELNLIADKADSYYIEDNLADDEEENASKKRIDRQDSTAVTPRPTTMRGIPLLRLLHSQVPRGFYVTKSELELEKVESDPSFTVDTTTALTEDPSETTSYKTTNSDENTTQTLSTLTEIETTTIAPSILSTDSTPPEAPSTSYVESTTMNSTFDYSTETEALFSTNAQSDSSTNAIETVPETVADVQLENTTTTMLPLTTVTERRPNRRREKFGSEFGQRSSGRRRVQGERVKPITEDKDVPVTPRRRVTVYRGRHRRPVSTSPSLLDDPKPSTVIVEQVGKEREGVKETTLSTEDNNSTGKEDEGDRIEDSTGRFAAEVNSSKNTSTHSPGSLLATRLRRPAAFASTSQQSKSSNTFTNHQKNRTTDEDHSLASVKNDAADKTTDTPKLEKDIDQSSRAQEIAVTLADPPPSPSTTGRPALRNAFRRKISTTIAPRKDPTTTTTTTTTSRSTFRFTPVVRDRQKPRARDKPVQNATTRPRRPQVIDYDYYEDEEESVIGKSTLNGKLFLTSKGSIRCLDQGNFPHPYSCRKFITCARMVNGLVVGAEYTCPDKLSFDPVGGICNWSAGLGCKE